MANKRPKPEEIVTKLRQVEVLTGQGMPRLDAIHHALPKRQPDVDQASISQEAALPPTSERRPFR